MIKEKKMEKTNEILIGLQQQSSHRLSRAGRKSAEQFS
jgi:hypothetical protein